VSLASATDAYTSAAHFLICCRRSSSLSEDEELVLENPIIGISGLVCTAIGITTDHDEGDCRHVSMMEGICVLKSVKSLTGQYVVSIIPARTERSEAKMTLLGVTGLRSVVVTIRVMASDNCLEL
jgi:hypothetical protein